MLSPEVFNNPAAMQKIANNSVDNFRRGNPQGIKIVYDVVIDIAKKMKEEDPTVEVIRFVELNTDQKMRAINYELRSNVRQQSGGAEYSGVFVTLASGDYFYEVSGGSGRYHQATEDNLKEIVEKEVEFGKNAPPSLESQVYKEYPMKPNAQIEYWGDKKNNDPDQLISRIF